VGNHRREFKALSNLQRDISKELSGLTQLAESGAPLDKTHLQRAQQIVKNIEHLLRQLDNFRKNQRPQSVRIFRVALTNAERELRAYLNTSQRLSRAIFQLTELEIATNSVIEISKPKRPAERSSPGVIKPKTKGTNSKPSSKQPSDFSLSEFEGDQTSISPVSSIFPSAVSEKFTNGNDSKKRNPAYGHTFCSQPGCFRPTRNGLCSEHGSDWQAK